MILSQKIEELGRLAPPQKDALSKLGVKTIEDLLYHFPVRYGDTAEMQSVATLRKGESVVIFGKVSKLKTSKGFRTHIAMAEGVIEDSSGSIKAVWFNQPYLAKMTPEGSFIRAEGKVSERKGELYLSNPKIEQITKLPTAVGDSLFTAGDEEAPNVLYPVYPESRGVTSNWIYHSIQKIFRSGALDSINDPIPDHILTTYNLPSWKTAMIWMHAPKNLKDAESARKRFAFEEILLVQIERLRDRMEWQKNPSFVIEKAREDIEKFTERFPFPLTLAQWHAIDAIVDDFKSGRAMSRLLEGDVGSGKTAVAAATVHAVVTTPPKDRQFGHLQTAYMCPTEILATQHFESFIQYFKHLPINIGLITGSGCRKFPSKVDPSGWTDISRSQLLKWTASGDISILIGTHALIQKTVQFKNLGYAIIDEQHRFGTAQRKKLVRKDGTSPHLLSMTATPIPRTLALTMYGDLDLTIIDQMPVGRKPILTDILTTGDRGRAYERIKTELESGRQAYIICPRIDEPDPDQEMAMNAKSVKEEAKRLKKTVFPQYEIGILHGKMKDDDKDQAMIDFKAGKTQILVATSVVEVGVNVPNATVILIEGAERFGLSQLHQLRGRVIRSNHQAYCFALSESKGEKTVDRLRALKTAKNGFELAELDLKARGVGDLWGRKQWGISDIAMEALKNIKMVEAARAEAQKLLDGDSELSHHPALKAEAERRRQNAVHFE